MKELSLELFSYFQTLTAFTGVMSNRCFPLIADAETAKPFATYNIRQQQGYTKDMNRFTVTLAAYFEDDQYDEAAEFSDAITSEIRSKYDWLESVIDFLDEDQSVIVNINFNVEK